MSIKNEMLSALQEFREATHNLSCLWGRFEYEYDGGQFRQLYPFAKSFDEVALDVNRWAVHAEAGINAIKEVEVTVKLTVEQARLLSDSGIKDYELRLTDEIEELIKTRADYLKNN